MSKLSANIVFIVLWLPAACLAQLSDTLHAAEPNKFIPTGIRLGVDAISLFRSEYERTFSGWEMSADVDFYRYFLVFDYGTWSRTFQPANGDYSNDGRYLRIGIDVNFLVNDPDKNMFFLGTRYGNSRFSEQYTFIVDDPLWGSLNQELYNDNIRARWFELTTGLRVKIYRFFWMGFTGSYKFGLKVGDTPLLLPHDVPGYGSTERNSTWGFTYQLLIRVPVRKNPVQISQQ